MVLLNLLLSRYHVVEHYHCHEWWSYSYCGNSPFISSKTQKWTNETRLKKFFSQKTHQIRKTYLQKNVKCSHLFPYIFSALRKIRPNADFLWPLFSCIRFCPYAGKYRSEKTRILAYFAPYSLGKYWDKWKY